METMPLAFMDLPLRTLKEIIIMIKTLDQLRILHLLQHGIPLDMSKML